MQQAAQKMQQAADDAAAIAAQQGGQGNPGDNGEGPGGQGQQAGGGQGQGEGGGQGEFAQGDANQQGNGQGGAGIGDGSVRARGQETNVGFKAETTTGETDESGRILASTLVKAMSDPGKSKVEISDVVESAEKESTDEVEQERIPRPAVKAVRDYFDDLKRGVAEPAESRSDDCRQTSGLTDSESSPSKTACVKTAPRRGRISGRRSLECELVPAIACP
jgi:hypothetical protein